jgi:hypothetical protein
MTSSRPPIPATLRTPSRSLSGSTGEGRFHRGDEFRVNLTAGHIVRYLEKAGYVVMKKPPALAAGNNPGGAGFEGLGPRNVVA